MHDHLGACQDPVFTQLKEEYAAAQEGLLEFVLSKANFKLNGTGDSE